MNEDTKERLGKIREVSVGFGGYQDAQLGISFTLGGEGWATSDFWGFWGMKPNEFSKWTEESQKRFLGETFLRIGDLLQKAKVNTVQDLLDIPVRVRFVDNRLSSWLVLTEVL